MAVRQHILLLILLHFFITVFWHTYKNVILYRPTLVVENFIVRKTVVIIIIIRQKLRTPRRRKTNRLRPSPRDKPTTTAVAAAILLLIIKNRPPRDRFVKYSRHNSSRVGVSSDTVYIYKI
jgi:hypothetical protein